MRGIGVNQDYLGCMYAEGGGGEGRLPGIPFHAELEDKKGTSIEHSTPHALPLQVHTEKTARPFSPCLGSHAMTGHHHSLRVPGKACQPQASKKRQQMVHACMTGYALLHEQQHAGEPGLR